MKVDIRRTGLPHIPPAPKSAPDPSWREWAYTDGKALQVALMGPVKMTVWPDCRDKRGVRSVTESTRVLGLVVEGLVAAGLLSDPEQVVELVVHRAHVTGESSLRVQLEDADEPF